MVDTDDTPRTTPGAPKSPHVLDCVCKERHVFCISRSLQDRASGIFDPRGLPVQHYFKKTRKLKDQDTC